MTSHTTRRQWLKALAGTAALSAAGARGQERDDRVTFSLAVVPQFPAAELHRDWMPLLERLGRETGLTLTLKLAPTIPRFETEVLQGGPDFAFMNPYHAVMASRAQGYVPMVHDTKPLTGILVVPKVDPIKSLAELDGKELAFPSPNAFGASLWMRALLAEREHIRISPVYVQTHSNVYRQVIRGKSAAGGGVNNTLLQESDEVRASLRVLFETPGVAPHPLCAHPRVPARVRQLLTEAILQLGTEPAGQALLKDVAMPRPLRADYARDYRSLEQYRLERYVVLETQG